MSIRTTMTRKMSFAFRDFVVVRYVESGMNNVDFARHATEHLPFPVTQAMVRTMLQDLDIAPNITRQTAAGRVNTQARIAELEDRFDRFTSSVTLDVIDLRDQAKALADSVRALAVRQNSKESK